MVSGCLGGWERHEVVYSRVGVGQSIFFKQNRIPTRVHLSRVATKHINGPDAPFSGPQSTGHPGAAAKLPGICHHGAAGQASLRSNRWVDRILISFWRGPIVFVSLSSTVVAVTNLCIHFLRGIRSQTPSTSLKVSSP